MFTGRTNPPVGLFGKLPSHPDFVRLNAGGPLPRALDEWLAEGLVEMRRLIGNGWEAPFDQAAPIFFIYRNNVSPTEALVGVCRPGQDQSGRRYPFTIFATAPVERGDRGYHLLPLGYSRFLRAARRFAMTECATGIDNERASRIIGLAGVLPQNLVETARRFDDHLREMTMMSFWQGVLGDFQDRRKYLVAKNLFAALGPLRGHDASRVNAVLRFPLGMALEDFETRVAVWLHLAGRIAGQEAMAQAVIFWREDGAPSAAVCHLCFRSPSPGLLPIFLVSTGNMSSVWDMETMGIDKLDAARDALGPAAEALDSPNLTMKEFIDRL